MLRLVFVVAAASVFATTIPAYLISHRADFMPQEPRTNTLSAQVPAERETPVSMPRYAGRQVQLSMDARGNFVGDFRLNGRRMAGIVDTGASTVAINATMARQIGIALKPSDFRYEVQTANGRTHAASAVIDEIEIGRIRVHDVQAMILDDDALRTALVGMSFLHQLSHFHVEGKRLTLVQ
jgi:aspartyl protease family protein